MINVYQEQIPFSNKMYDKPISQGATYTNPVIIPYAFNATGIENVMETVVYLKNDAQQNFYKTVVVSIMKEADGITPVNASGTFNYGDNTFSLNGTDASAGLAYEYSSSSLVTLTNQYKSNYVPVVDDGTLAVKFSYGYDELSYPEWKSKSPIMVIPSIGSVGSPDTSYIPVRMRLTWKITPSILTIRDYFIDVSYSEELEVIS